MLLAAFAWFLREVAKISTLFFGPVRMLISAKPKSHQGIRRNLFFEELPNCQTWFRMPKKPRPGRGVCLMFLRLLFATTSMQQCAKRVSSQECVANAQNLFVFCPSVELQTLWLLVGRFLHHGWGSVRSVPLTVRRNVKAGQLVKLWGDSQSMQRKSILSGTICRIC